MYIKNEFEEIFIILFLNLFYFLILISNNYSYLYKATIYEILNFQIINLLINFLIINLLTKTSFKFLNKYFLNI